jgi:uncharacterized damage-inducible protein DinB
MLQPDQAVLLLHSMLPTVENEFGITQKVLAAVPDEKASYRPNEYSMTAFDLAWHIASAETRFLGGLAAGEFSFEPFEKPATMHGIVAFHAEHFHAVLPKLKALTGEQAAKVMDFRGVFQWPAVAYLTFNNNHIIHHRGQLSTYLRPMGVKVPAIYGESYDSALAKKQMQTA